jgi:hypothetical protein
MTGMATSLRGSLIDALDDERMSGLVGLAPIELVEYMGYILRLQDDDVNELQHRLDEAGVSQAELDRLEVTDTAAHYAMEDKMWEIAHAYFEGR